MQMITSNFAAVVGHSFSLVLHLKMVTNSIQKLGLNKSNIVVIIQLETI